MQRLWLQRVEPSRTHAVLGTLLIRSIARRFEMAAKMGAPDSVRQPRLTLLTERTVFVVGSRRA